MEVRQHAIQMWDDGNVTTITRWGGAPHLNDRGDIAFGRFYDEGPVGAGELWLYHAGRFSQLSWHRHDQGWNNVGIGPWAITNAGEMMICEGRPWAYESKVELWTPLLTQTRPRLHVAEPAGRITAEAMQVRTLQHRALRAVAAFGSTVSCRPLDGKRQPVRRRPTTACWHSGLAAFDDQIVLIGNDFDH
jgi:hypothetical protein